MALVQSKAYASTGNQVNHSVVFDSAPTEGNWIILCVVADTTFDIPSGYSRAVSAINFTQTDILYKQAGAGESATQTVTLDGSTSCAIHGFEYSELAANPFDESASNTPSGDVSSVSTGTTGTTDQDDELAIAVVGQSTTLRTVNSWSNSFTAALSSQTSGSSPNVRADTATRTLTETATYSTTASLSGNTAFPVGAIATFRVDTGGASVVPVIMHHRRMLGMS